MLPPRFLKIEIYHIVIPLTAACLTALIGCGGGGIGNRAVVSISPASATLAPGKALQFRATVTGAEQRRVTWSASAGTISAGGLLTVPTSSSATVISVKASSMADNQESASANVIVTAPAPGPTAPAIGPNAPAPGPIALAPGPTITSTLLPSAEVSTSYSSLLSAAGGQTPYRWTIASGALPAGLQLESASGKLKGIPSAQGQSTFAVEVTDQNGETGRQSFKMLVVDASACLPPSYPCARTDLDVSSLPAAPPSWGGRLGANTVFTDPSFNPQYPPRYVRVTDANSAIVSGVNSSMSVGAGSGDDKHFNADDSLFTITDSGQNVYFYGLDPTTMATGLVWVGDLHAGDGQWSQSDRNIWFGIGGDGRIRSFDFTDCHLGGPSCNPPATPVYNFIANCGLNPTIVYHEQGGTSGANDTVFAATYSSRIQDTGDQVVVYNSSTSTCYFYNTRAGTIRSYVGTQTPVTGAVNCDGTNTITWTSGTQFDPSWAGLYIAIAGKYYELEAVNSSTSARFYSLSANCTAGTALAYSIKPGTLLGTITSPDRYSVHNLRLDPSGNWLIVVRGSSCYSTLCVTVHAWQVGTTTVVNCVTACGGHYTESASGWFNNDTIPGDLRKAATVFRSWENFATSHPSDLTYLNTSDPATYSFFDMHPSNKNDPLGTNSHPIFTSTVSLEPGVITGVMSNEIIGYQQPPGPILRFGHTFNSGLSTDFTTKYAIGAASSTGHFYMFTTDCEGTCGSKSGAPTCKSNGNLCRSDVFILNLTPPGGAKAQR